MGVNDYVLTMNGLRDSSDDTYVSNKMHDLLFTIAYYADDDNANKDSEVVALKANGTLGNLNIPYLLASWAFEPSFAFTVDYDTDFSAYANICNIDAKGGQLKGVIGVLG